MTLTKRKASLMNLPVISRKFSYCGAMRLSPEVPPDPACSLEPVVALPHRPPLLLGADTVNSVVEMLCDVELASPVGLHPLRSGCL